jgi:hypothetical protein
MALALALRGQLPAVAELPPGLSSWLYLGEGAAARIELERTIGGRLERISTAESLQRHADALKRPYIDAIGSLSLFNDSPEWWASELAAKSPYARLFERVCALAVARDLLGSGLDGCLVVCATPALLAEVESAAASAGTETLRVDTPVAAAESPRLRARIAGTLVDRVGPRLPLYLVDRAARYKPWIRGTLETSHTFRRRILESLGATTEPLSGPGTALLLTWLDHRNVTPEGSYVDPHLGSLPEALRGRGYRLAFLPRLLRTAGFADLVQRLLGTGERFLFPELLLDEAVLHRCEATAQAFSPVIPDASNVAGVPFARLAREQAEHYRTAQGQNLVYEPLVEQLARTGVAPELVVHTFEGHAWEQVLAGAVHRHLPDTRVIGCDNLNMTRFALSRFPAAAELGLRPLPDRIVTNGRVPRDALVAEGVPESMVAAGCAIRHARLFAPRNSVRETGANQPVVLVATDASFDRSVELVVKAVEAFGSDDAWKLVVKCHPLVATHTVEAFVRTTTGVDGIYVDRPFGELLSGAGVLLYTYSSVCYEALAAGVPPVFVQGETDLDLDQLEPFPDLRWTARTAAELRAAARAILDLEPAERAAWQERAREALRATLTPVTPDCVEAFLP